MIYKKRVLLIDDTGEIATPLKEVFANDEVVDLVCSSSSRAELKRVLRYDFFLIYIHHDGLIADLKTLVEFVTAYLNYLHPAFIAISSDEKAMLSSDCYGVGFVPKPINFDILRKQILNAIAILSANRSITCFRHFFGANFQLFFPTKIQHLLNISL